MVCFFDTESNEHRFQLIKTERGYLRTLLRKRPADLVVMEACTASGWVSDLCQELKLETLVCCTPEAGSPPQAESVALAQRESRDRLPVRTHLDGNQLDT